MSLWTAFLLGLLGGVHCAGMCGPLVLALPMPVGGRRSFAVARLVYQLGRIGTYGLLGVVFGLAGKSLALVGVQRTASIAIGVLLLVALLLSRRVRLGGWIASLVVQLRGRMAGLLQDRSLGAQAALGMLNGLLPCGLVYVAGAGAAAEQGVLEGAVYMLMFGLGTFPAMYGISLSGRLLPASWRLSMRRVIPAGVVMLALLLILRGMALGIPYVSPDLAHDSCACHSR